MSKVVKIFGLVADDAGSSHNFNGEIVQLSTQGEFLFNRKIYKPHEKQTEPVELLYPNEIWVKEPCLTPNPQDPDALIVEPTDISNGYARRGSHWIRYFIDPQSLILSGEDSEEAAQEKALEVANLIVNKASLHKVLKEVGITDENLVEEILLRL